MEELLTIQQKLNAPKGQYNSFGKYKYRSCEDILAAVKPLLNETKSTLTLSDEIILVGNRIYVKATATLRTESGKEFNTTAFAREDDTKKGMDGAQVTGSASSYARKYALNGLFSIDDTKDPDATNTHGAEQTNHSSQNNQRTAEISKEALNELTKCNTEAEFNAVWSKYANKAPEICQNGTEFYNAACRRINDIRQSNVG